VDESTQDAQQVVQGAGPAAGEQRAPAVDPEKLADVVYKLMLAEVRLERVRGQPVVPGGKR
jgi:hypothetical protein